MTEISKCPWCHTKLNLRMAYGVASQQVECVRCGSRGPLRGRQRDAIRAWNRVARASRSEKKGGA